MNRKARHMACNFNCCIETEGLLKVKDNHIGYAVKVVISRKWCKIETLLLQSTNRKRYYIGLSRRIAPFPTTLNDRQGHLCVASLFKCDFSCSFAAVNMQDFN